MFWILKTKKRAPYNQFLGDFCYKKPPPSPIKHLCVTLVEVQYRRDWYIVSSILTA